MIATLFKDLSHVNFFFCNLINANIIKLPKSNITISIAKVESIWLFVSSTINNTSESIPVFRHEAIIPKIKPLKLIKNYIDDIKNDKESELHIQREDEIGVLSSSLIEMKEEIDRQNEIKEEMIHNISHDLKTPIALIQTYAQSIKDDIYPYGDKDSSVDVILENTDRLEKKVKSLLYLNRLDYISGQIGDETCSMKELIEHIVFQLTAMHPQIEIITDLQDSSFKGKDDYWRICIENIIENAARYVHHEIKIILKDQYLEIFNDGEPIDNSNPESLFQPYEIGHKGQFGLGLSIVYKTVTMYGYKVEAVNRVDGVSFIIQNKD